MLAGVEIEGYYELLTGLVAAAEEWADEGLSGFDFSEKASVLQRRGHHRVGDWVREFRVGREEGCIVQVVEACCHFASKAGAQGGCRR